MAKKKEDLDSMEREALRRQDNLAQDIDELLDRVNPKNVAQRWVQETKDSVKDFFEGGVDKAPTKNVMVVTGTTIAIVIGVIGLKLLTRKSEN